MEAAGQSEVCPASAHFLMAPLAYLSTCWPSVLVLWCSFLPIWSSSSPGFFLGIHCFYTASISLCFSFFYLCAFQSQPIVLSGSFSCSLAVSSTLFFWFPFADHWFGALTDFSHLCSRAVFSCPDRAAESGGRGVIIRQTQRTELYNFIITWQILIVSASLTPAVSLTWECFGCCFFLWAPSPRWSLHTAPSSFFCNWLVCSSSLALHPSSYFPSLIYSSCPLPSFLLQECEASLQKNIRSLWTSTIPPVFPLPSPLSSPHRWWDKYLLVFILRLVKLAYSPLFLSHEDVKWG